VVELPLEVQPGDRGFDLRASVALRDLYPPDGDPSGRARLRLRVVWNNSAWETVLRRTRGARRGVEVSFDGDGTLTLARHTSGR
jgi:poly(glycerol-phosphate) alpha-glucosyltransferase